jgi:hypothetical protein
MGRPDSPPLWNAPAAKPALPVPPDFCANICCYIAETKGDLEANLRNPKPTFGFQFNRYTVNVVYVKLDFVL